MDDMKRRIRQYRKLNNSEIAEPAVQDFFNEQGIKFYKENISTRFNDALNGFKIYIERVSKSVFSILQLITHIICLERETI